MRELGFDSMLWPTQKATYVAKPVDADFTILTSRRTTLELVMRRYVETLPNVTITDAAPLTRVALYVDVSIVKTTLPVGVTGDPETVALRVTGWP